MAGTRRKQSNRNSGKSLFGRITPVDRLSETNKEKKEGYTVVDGKLVSANDVGLLLRQASSRVEARSSGKSRNKNTMTRNEKKIIKSQASERTRVSLFKKGGSKDRMNMASKSDNKLVISTNSNGSDQVLLFQNLALGVNQESLKTVLEQLSDARISKVRVKDLPSGSATANVWLHKPSVRELERVRKLFDGALVDGRTIRVTLVHESSQKLSY